MSKNYNSVFLTNFEPLIESSLSQTANTRKLTYEIGKYLDDNNEALSYNVPLYRVSYDMTFIYKIIKFDDKDVKHILPNVKYQGSMKNNYFARNPVFIILTLLIRYYSLDPKKKKYKEAVLTYFAVVIYSILMAKYFPFTPNDNIMQYTYNRINNHFYFRKYGSVLKAIVKVAEGNDELLGKNLVKDSDMAIAEYATSLYYRLNNQMRSFSNEFYKDQQKKNYLNQDINVSDNPDMPVVPENVSYTINTVSQFVTVSFFQNSVDMRLLRLACNMTTGVVPNSLVDTLEDLKKNEVNRVVDTIKRILIVYLSDTNNNKDLIGSKQFIAYSLKVFNKNNTTDKNVLAIRENLNYFLEHYCSKYNQTSRAATKSNYRKAIFIYFVLLIADRS